LDNVQKAANALKQGSDERKPLEKVLSFYGKEGDKNGVKVAFGDLNRGGVPGGNAFLFLLLLG
jgi:hypothetical protein